MRKTFLLALAAAALGLTVAAQAQPYHGHRDDDGDDYGPGWMMGSGYGGGYMMGPGYGGGYGPGMMYGYRPDGRSYHGGQAYRGKKLCWHETDAGRNTGYYEPCGD